MAEHEVDGVLADALVPLQQLLQVNRIGAVLVRIRRSARRRSYIAIVGAAGIENAVLRVIDIDIECEREILQERDVRISRETERVAVVVGHIEPVSLQEVDSLVGRTGDTRDNAVAIVVHGTIVVGEDIAVGIADEGGIDARHIQRTRERTVVVV